MSYIVLSDKDLSAYTFPENVEWKQVTYKSLDNYNNNQNVCVIAGSRAMAIKACEMDFPCLKLFQLTSAGFDNVPLIDYQNKGVAVANAGNTYSIPISETVILGILLMAKKLRKNPNNRRAKLTRGYCEITELAGKKLLIMGTGNIGTAVAGRLFNGFEMQIDGYDPYSPKKEQYDKLFRTRQELLENIGLYDYIVCTMPDNPETKQFINLELLSKMKSNAVIINVGRKAVFNQEELYKVLKKKLIGGAVLDMFQKIPNPITNKFRRLKNVIVLPGVSAISKEVNVRLKEHMYKNIMAVLENKPISNVINGGE